MIANSFLQAVSRRSSLLFLRRMCLTFDPEDLPTLPELLLFITNDRCSSAAALKALQDSFPRAVCGRRLQDEPAVKCQTCSNDLSSVICLPCFDASRHAGHKFDYITASGMCDCGYRCTIDPAGFCCKHKGNHLLREFQAEKRIFDDSMTKRAIFALASCVFGALVQRRRDLYDAAVQLLKELVFNQEIDYLRNCFTRALFVTPEAQTAETADQTLEHEESEHFGQTGQNNETKEAGRTDKTDELAAFDEFQAGGGAKRQILPFVDLEKIYTQDSSRIDGIAAFYVLCQSERYFCFSEENTDVLTDLLTQEQISEPLFRFLMIFCYYMRSTFLIQQVTDFDPAFQKIIVAARSNEPAVLYHVPFTPTKQIQKVPWCDVPVQLYTDHFLDFDHALLVTGVEFLTHWPVIACMCYDGKWSATKKTQLSDYGQLLISRFQKELASVDARLYSDTVIQNMVQFDISAFEQYIPAFCTAAQTSECISARLSYFSMYLYHAEFVCYSEKIAQYFQQVCSYDLPYFCHLFIMQPLAVIEVPRYRDRRVLEHDAELNQALNRQANIFDAFYNNLLGMYAGMLYQERPNIYSLDHAVVRTNDEFVCSGACTVREFHLEALFYLLIQMSTHPRYYFSYSTQNVHPQIPYGYGYHTQTPLVKSDAAFATGYDVKALGFEPLTMVANIYVTALAFVLQVYSEYQARDASLAPAPLLLRNVLETRSFVNQLPKYNFPIVTAWAVRQAVAIGLLEGRFFRQLVGAEEYIKFILFENSNSQQVNVAHSCFAVLQTCFLGSLSSAIFTPRHFIHEVLEHYGAVSARSGAFAAPAEAEDRGKMLLLYGHALKTLMLLVMRKQTFSSHRELKLKYILAFLLFNRSRCTSSEFRKQFANQIIYNSELFDELLESVTERSSIGAQAALVYDSQRCTTVFQLNKAGLEQLSYFDGFFAGVPMLGAEFKNAAERLKLKTLPKDLLERPQCGDAARALFQDELFKALARFLAEQTLLQPDAQAARPDLGQIFLLLALKWIIYYNTENAAFVALLNAVPREQAFYSDAVWQVLTDVTKKQPDRPKLTLSQRLERLHGKLAVGYESTAEEIQTLRVAELPADVLHFVRYLEHINEFQTHCTVCAAKTRDSVLHVLCNVARVDLHDEPLAVAQTCQHLIHAECQPADKDLLQCTLCRQFQPYIAPLVLSTDLSANFQCIMRFLDMIRKTVRLDALDRLNAFFAEASGQVHAQDCEMLFYEVFQHLVRDQLTYLHYLNAAYANKTLIQSANKSAVFMCFSYYICWLGICEIFQIDPRPLVPPGFPASVLGDCFYQIARFQLGITEDVYNDHIAQIAASGRYRYLALDSSYQDFAYEALISQSLRALTALSGALSVFVGDDAEAEMQKLLAGLEPLDRAYQENQTSQVNQVGENEVTLHPDAKQTEQTQSSLSSQPSDGAQQENADQEIALTEQQSVYAAYSGKISQRRFERLIDALLSLQNVAVNQHDGHDLTALSSQNDQPRQMPPRRVKLMSFPQYFSDFLQAPGTCACCSQTAHCLCVFCGGHFCAAHFNALLQHSDECQNGRSQLCFFVPVKNIVFYRVCEDAYYFSGGPYLSEQGEDDCQRFKRIPLYLNQLLLENLTNMLDTANTQLNPGFVLTAERIRSFLRQWFGQ